MKKSVHLSDQTVEYIANRSVADITYSTHINAAFEQLAHLAAAEKPNLTDQEWVELYNVYTGSNLDRLVLPINLAADLMTHYGATLTSQLPPDCQLLAERLVTMPQSQQFAVIDAVRVFLAQRREVF